MQKLNLPEFKYSLKKADGKVWIFDMIRKKFVVLTPEEWVRQHMVNYMVSELKYPKSLIKVEGGLVYNQMNKRSDIVVFDRGGKPWMIIECKAPELKITQNTLEQVSVYNATHRAKFVSVTNGIQLYCASTDWSQNKFELLTDFPKYE